MVLAAIIAPGLAAANCTGALILSCPVVGSEKFLDVCATPRGFTYAFGPDGAPEIELVAPYESGPVQPWPGVGSNIWSSVRFVSGDYVYEAWVAADRMSEDAPLDGGVRVLSMPSEEIFTEQTCRTGEVAGDVFGASDSMAQAGFCWNLDTQEWRVEGECG
jgi:hypothetical protein